jgi:signal transduction histidine kinase
MLVLIAVLVGLPVMVIGQLLTDRAQSDSREDTLAQVTAGASAGASTVADQIGALTSRSQSMSASVTMRALVQQRDGPGLEAWLADLVPLYGGDVQRLFILDTTGQFIASAPTQRALSGTSFSHADYFVEATNPWRPFVSRVYRTTFDNQPTAITIAVPVVDSHGNPLGLLCAAIDLTRAQNWLAPLTALFDDVYLVDQQGVLVFGFDNHGSDSTPLRDLTGDPNVRAALAGQHVRTEADDQFSGESRFVASAPVASVGWTVLVAEYPEQSIQRLATLSDGLFALRLVLLALLLGGGVLLSRTTLRQQRIALADLRKLNKSKSDFVSVVSHEFRTPLTGIQGFSEMIRDEDLSTEDVKDFANDINKDAHRLSRMITELLDLDRMESGRMTQNRERVDLGALVTEAVQHARPTASRHAFVLELDPALPEIWADRDRITQVLTNLISNAVKYSPDGGAITVGTARLDDAAHCWVRDEGMGIPPESLETVFERYSRLETTKTRTIQGTGLGLPIVREICQAHGGRAWAESTQGSGSTFHITLPFDQRSAA